MPVEEKREGLHDQSQRVKQDKLGLEPLFKKYIYIYAPPTTLQSNSTCTHSMYTLVSYITLPVHTACLH